MVKYRRYLPRDQEVETEVSKAGVLSLIYVSTARKWSVHMAPTTIVQATESGI